MFRFGYALEETQQEKERKSKNFIEKTNKLQMQLEGKSFGFVDDIFTDLTV